jgi:prophage regulatory protein
LGENDPHGIPPPQLIVTNTLPFRRTIRRPELRQIVPLADTTIYDMERRGEFPRRFNLTARCVVWDLTEVEAWLDARRQASDSAQLKRAPSPDVRQRKRRPVKATPVS